MSERVTQGWVDHDLAKRPHVCRTPDLYRFGVRQPGAIAPPVYGDHPEGTRYHCTCGVVWVVRWRHGRGLQASGLTWARESRGERRQRLGLRWWQRTRPTLPAEERASRRPSDQWIRWSA